MANSRRREITNYIKDQLSLINGQTSTLDPLYKYSKNLFGNVFRRVKFIDEINDFPSIYLQAGTENRIYQSYTLVEAKLEIVIRTYVKSPTPAEDLESLTQDIEHVIYNIPSNLDIGIIDITIDNISNDEGLLAPFGIGEIFITVHYELED